MVGSKDFIQFARTIWLNWRYAKNTLCKYCLVPIDHFVQITNFPRRSFALKFRIFLLLRLMCQNSVYCLNGARILHLKRETENIYRLEYYFGSCTWLWFILVHYFQILFILIPLLSKCPSILVYFVSFLSHFFIVI